MGRVDWGETKWGVESVQVWVSLLAPPPSGSETLVSICKPQSPQLQNGGMMPIPQLSKHSEIGKTQPLLILLTLLELLWGCIYKCLANNRCSVTGSYDKKRRRRRRSGSSSSNSSNSNNSANNLSSSVLEVMLTSGGKKRPYLRDGKYIVCILTVSFHTMQTWSINYQHIFSFKLGQCLRILVITMPRQHYQPTREGT